MTHPGSEIKRDLHAGIIGFAKEVNLHEVVKIAEMLCKGGAFPILWIRGVASDRWGIEFISKCNSFCRSGGIQSEVDFWLSKVRKTISSDKISSYDIGGKVILVNPKSC